MRPSLWVFLVVSLCMHLLVFIPGYLFFKTPQQSFPSLFIVERLRGSSLKRPQPLTKIAGEKKPALFSQGLMGNLMKVVSGNPKPPYPAVARRLRLFGTAIVSVKVSPQGLVEQIHFEKRTGHAILDESIVTTVKGWTIPHTHETSLWITLPPFDFILKEDS